MSLYPSHRIIVRLTLAQTLHAQAIQNAYYFANRTEMESSNLISLMTNLINDFKDLILPQIKLLQSQENVYRSLVAISVNPKEAAIVESILSTSEGSVAYESLPSYCAAILSLRTGGGSKSDRGRSYYAGIGEGSQQGGRLDTLTFGQLQTIGNQFLSYFGNTMVTSPFQYVVFSRKRAESGETDLFPEEWVRSINQIIARPVLGTQRHRKIGIGN